MPPRSNFFQDVVAIIHRHMAGEATVEESAMLPNSRTGELREIDVVVRSRTATHDTLVKIEARSGKRKADSTWVEQQLGRHKNLPPGTLVLVSEAGFSTPARDLAEKEGAVALSPEIIDGDDPASGVITRLKGLWPKLVTLKPESARVWVEQPQSEVGSFRATPDLDLVLEDGTPLGQLLPLAQTLYQGNFPALAEQIGLESVAQDEDWVFRLQLGPPWALQREGQLLRVCLRWGEGPDAGRLDPVEKAIIYGKAEIRVTRIDLKHRRLGEITYAYGSGLIGGQSATVVVTASDQFGTVTVRYAGSSDADFDAG